MAQTESKNPIQVAQAELITLATAVRPDWSPADIQAALIDAKTCGWTWSKALVGLVRLVVDPEARPSELTPPPLDPNRSVVRGPVASVAEHSDTIAAAKVACERATAKHKAAERGTGDET